MSHALECVMLFALGALCACLVWAVAPSVQVMRAVVIIANSLSITAWLGHRVVLVYRGKQ